MARIFISYSRADKMFVNEFVPLLRKVYGNDSVWFDDDIHGGSNWWQMILSEVADCELFVYLASNDSLASPYCQAEFREALRLHKQILPVIVRPKTDYPGDVPGDLEAVLHRTQYVDMSKGFGVSEAHTNLHAAVHRLLEQAQSVALAPLSPEPVGEPDVPDKPPAQSMSLDRRITIVAALVIIVVVAAVILSGIGGSGGDGQETPTATTGVVVLSPTDTPSYTPTLDAIAAAQATNDVEATVNAARTQIYIDGLTATATLWTDTPTPTVNPTPGYSSDNPITANDQWMVVSRDFNGVEMVLVPAGCFMMGSEDGYNESPAHEQCFDDPFWVDRYEVTNEQYGSSGWWSEDNLPRESVNWFNARAHCERRGARLPTEAEWEYAARGPDNLIYPWGDTFVSDRAVYSSSSGDRTREVGSRPRGMSWVGAHDMSGNVWEWVSSIYREYPYNNSWWRESNSDTDSLRVLRGGSWDNNESNLRSADRSRLAPSVTSNLGGIRCARSYSPDS